MPEFRQGRGYDPGGHPGWYVRNACLMPMRTPAGSECKYFFGDYFRGRNREECSLLGDQWEQKLCGGCPVPAIIRANACDFMQLKAEVEQPILALFKKQVKVHTFCRKTGKAGFDAHIGCGECHVVPPLFMVKES